MAKAVDTHILSKHITAIQAIAQTGLAYTRDEFDKQRYRELMSLASQLLSNVSNIDSDEINQRFLADKGYVTPKLDVRAFVVKKDKLLLVKERSDGLWTLPGGWADVNESPAEAIAREVQEETGFEVSVTRLLALWDKQKHDHPPQWPHAYKCFFQCEILQGEPTVNLEVSAIEFFPLTDLPPLSLDRVTQSQIIKLDKIIRESSTTEFD